MKTSPKKHKKLPEVPTTCKVYNLEDYTDLVYAKLKEKVFKYQSFTSTEEGMTKAIIDSALAQVVKRNVKLKLRDDVNYWYIQALAPSSH